MKIKYQDYERFYKDFYKLIIELECGKHFDRDNPQHEEWLQKRIRYLFVFGKAICLYNSDETPAGFLFLEFDPGLDDVRCFGKKAVIRMFGLFPEYRSWNIGKQLLDECERYLKDAGCDCLYVDTYARNSGAIRYYVDHGFVPVACHPGENGIDDVGQVYLWKEIR
ncbi:MAG: GNAT family N-acetyltransferase [Spirochaetales bacterium]|nr:GNAT family N-acetyltransferase [Spirochaetales bacterium]